MPHELTGEIRGNHIHMKLLKMKIIADGLDTAFNPSVGAEIVLAGCEQQLPGDVFEAKHNHGNPSGHGQDAKKHLAQHFKVTAKSQQLAVVHCAIWLRLSRCLVRFRLFPFLLLSLRHVPLLLTQVLRALARSSLS